MTQLKKHLKSGILLIIESNASPTAIILKLSKTQIIKILDAILPDEPAGTSFSLRDEK